MASSILLRIPICFAIADAVILWSPVIITGLMPALIQSATACALSTLGGSIIAIKPKKVR